MSTYKERIIKSITPIQYCLHHDINMTMTELIHLAARVSKNESPGIKKQLLEEMEKIIDYEKRFCNKLNF